MGTTTQPSIALSSASSSFMINYQNLPPQTTSVFVNKDTGQQFSIWAVQFYDGGTGTRTVQPFSWLHMTAGNYFLRAYDWTWQHVITESNTVYFVGI